METGDVDFGYHGARLNRDTPCIYHTYFASEVHTVGISSSFVFCLLAGFVFLVCLLQGWAGPGEDDFLHPRQTWQKNKRYLGLATREPHILVCRAFYSPFHFLICLADAARLAGSAGWRAGGRTGCQ